MLRAFLSILLACLAPATFAQPVTSETGVEPFQANPAAAPKMQSAAPQGSASVEFIGAKSFRERELRAAIAEQIAEIGQSGLAPATADDAAFFLGIFYRKNGFPEVNVQWKIKPGQTLELTVGEGPQTTVGDIRFTGNKNMTTEVLKGYLLGTTRERFQKKILPYVESDIETGIERIQALYQDNGFLDVVVDPAQVSFSDGNSRADLAITIHEGIQYHFGKLDIEGDLMFYNFQPASNRDDLRAKLKPFTQNPYTPEAVTNIERAIVYYYRQHGYYDVKAEAASDPAAANNGIVPVTFHVATGNVYRFGSVQENGLDRLHPGFLQKRFRKLQGKFYNPEKLDEIYRALMRTGLFKLLRITPKPTPSNEINLDMEAEEAKSKDLGFLAGYGNLEGFLGGIQATERDLFGTGRSITGSAEFAQRLLKGEVQYFDPWLFESDYTLRLKADALSQEFTGYTKFETGGRIELGRTINTHVTVSLFMLPREVQISDITISPTSEAGPTTYFVNSLGTTLTVDQRNSVTNPTKGFIFTASGDYAGGALGSEIDFVRGTCRFSYYIPVTKNSVLAFGARAGVLVPLDGSASIPIDERFFNGGESSVRSFAERELGPKDASGDNPIGGDTFTTFNLEYDFPLIGNLGGATFTDAGSVGQTVSDGIGLMRYAVGGGLRYKLPIGPIRFDYGLNPSPRPGEKQGAFNFSFGFAF